MNVNVQSLGILQGNRGTFEVFKNNDTNPTTNKTGIRCYTGIVKLILRIIELVYNHGLVYKFNADEGEVIWFNKRSLEKWLEWRRGTIEVECPDVTLDLEDILQYFSARKEAAINCDMLKILGTQKAQINLELQELETIKTQLDTKFQDQNEQLTKKLKEKQVYQTVQQKFNTRAGPLWKTNGKTKLKKILKQQFKESGIDTSNLKQDSSFLQALSTQLKTLPAEIASLEVSLKVTVQSIEENIQIIAEKKSELEKVDEEIEIKRRELKANERILNPQSIEVEELSSTLQTLSATERALLDIEQYACAPLKNLMQALFDKFSDSIANWTCDARGNFSLTCALPAKMWCRPRNDRGAYDGKTPKGVVILLCANSETKLSGKLTRNTISFKTGLSSHCKFSTTLLSGTANSSFDRILYDPSSEKATVLVTANALGFTKNKTETKLLERMISEWRLGKVLDPQSNHEAYLEKLQISRDSA